jgi:hypothetical protein
MENVLYPSSVQGAFEYVPLRLRFGTQVPNMMFNEMVQNPKIA